MVGSLDLQRVLRDGEHAFSPGPAGPRARRRAVRRRGQPAARPPGRRAARRRGDGPRARRARRRLAQPRRAVHADRHDESRRGRTASAVARPVRADRRRPRVPRRRRAGRGDPAAAWPTRPTPTGSPRATPTTTPTWPAGSPRPARWSADVVLPDNELRRIAALCAAFDVDGMRADLVVARTAVAHAAWRGADHRRRRRTSGSPPNWRCRTGAAATRSTIPASTRISSTRRMAQAGEPADASRTTPSPNPDPPGGGGEPRPTARRAEAARRSAASRRRRRGVRGPTRAPSATFRTKALVVPGVGEGAPGRRSRARNRTGHRGVGHRRSATPGTACTCSARCWPRRPGSGGRGRLRLRPDDVRRAIREGPRRQSGDLRRRRVGVDGRARPDGAPSAAPRCRCCATPTSAATRSP